jgi:TPR repeat protein
MDAILPGKDIPDKALQALTRSSDRGCPVSQFVLALCLQQGENLDPTISLLQSAAKSGLIEAHLHLGRGFI